jgi:hypothetical protein
MPGFCPNPTKTAEIGDKTGRRSAERTHTTANATHLAARQPLISAACQAALVA